MFYFIFQSIKMTLFYIIAIIIAVVCLYIKWSHSYWQRLGVPYLKPSFITGNVGPMLTSKLPPGIFFTNLYNTFKERGWKHAGFYVFNYPIWMPVDVELIKNILTKDFGYFPNHNPALGADQEKYNPIAVNLFNLTNDRWRNLRIKLTPTFTTGKLKMMFQILTATTAGLREVLEEYAASQDAVDIKDVVARFTTDVIGNCAFGLDCNSLKNPNSEFRIYGQKLFKRRGGLKKILGFLLGMLPSSVRIKLGIKLMEPDVESFFTKIVKDTIEYRERSRIIRKDFMHLLIQLKNNGLVTDDENLVKTAEGKTDVHNTLSMHEIIAQCVLFFLAGFETSATTMSFALLEMSLNPEVQEKLRREIRDVLMKYDGQLSYEAVMDMKYLDMVIHETLRKHPPVPLTPRVCTKDYKIPDTNITIKKGTQLSIPIYGIQHDPDYYPDPEKFDPTRFAESNIINRIPYTFLAFGEGPRICLGARFGLMQTKVGLITVIRHFKVSLNERTKTPIKYDPKSYLTVVDGGIWINVHKID